MARVPPSSRLGERGGERARENERGEEDELRDGATGRAL
jgi:hypothetical protein